MQRDDDQEHADHRCGRQRVRDPAGEPDGRSLDFGVHVSLGGIPPHPKSLDHTRLPLFSPAEFSTVSMACLASQTRTSRTIDEWTYAWATRSSDVASLTISFPPRRNCGGAA